MNEHATPPRLSEIILLCFILCCFSLGPYLWIKLLVGYLSHPEQVSTKSSITAVIAPPPPFPSSPFEDFDKEKEEVSENLPSSQHLSREKNKLRELHQVLSLAEKELRGKLKEWESYKDEEDFEMRKIQELPPEGFTLCGYIDHLPQPINLKEVMQLIFEEYSRSPFAGEITCTVVLRVMVNKRGEITQHKTISIGHPICLKMVKKYISRIQFFPLLYQGKPTASWVNIPFRFRLENQD